MVLITILEKVNEYFKCIGLWNIFRKLYGKKEKRKNDFFFYNISHEHGIITFSKWSIKKYSKEVPKKKKKKPNKQMS